MPIRDLFVINFHDEDTLWALATDHPDPFADRRKSDLNSDIKAQWADEAGRAGSFQVAAKKPATEPEDYKSGKSREQIFNKPLIRNADRYTSVNATSGEEL